ncbi:IS21-like element helper ATPase IstB [Aneurinibacillus tyrosinisolvens]|uniref:IS21-like element helper ATPase IstB n=1 Tax=Aneurinibacillus tyrosinisolvens TaxID=1443435 RepID=UPI00063F5729|nr:IS21-like element helper ATPase IstB [Aneurinibacillus tyrosinisolvens]
MEVYLKRLKLRRIREVFEERCLQAEQEKWTYEAFLLHLLEEEIEARNQTVEQKRMRAAKFPSEKTMGDFDFTFQHGLSKEKIMRLSTLDFIEKRENVMMIGPAGVGKTHLAIALGREAVTAGYAVLFRTAQQLVEELYASLADGTVAKRIQSYLRNDLLIIDEFGYLPMDETASNHLFQVVSHLYEQKSIIVTSNLSFREWPTAFSSEAIAVATLDRLLHHSHRLVFNGDSYRLKGKKTAN